VRPKEDIEMRDRSNKTTFDTVEVRHLLTFYATEECARQQRAIPAFVMVTLVRMALVSVLRTTEVCAIRVRDLDLDAGAHPVIHVEGHMTGVRGIPLPQAMGPMLSVYLERLEHEGFDVGEDAPLFPDHDGALVNGHVLREQWHRVLKDAGLPARPFQALRRTATERRASVTPEHRLVDKLLGHRSVTSVLYDNTSVDQLAALQDVAWSGHPVLTGASEINSESDDTGTIIDRDEVQLRAGMGITDLFAAIREGNFPPPITRADGEWPCWRASDVEKWIADEDDEGAAR
jgi:site-specific recombinase XerC/predicted DNA-binding transcriptional regulator AlpA